MKSRTYTYARGRKVLLTTVPTNAGNMLIETDTWANDLWCRVMPMIDGEQDVFCQLATYQPDEKVFEVGYGSGVLMLHAGLCGADVRGVDSNIDAYRMAGLNGCRVLEYTNPDHPRRRCRAYFSFGQYESHSLARHSQDTIIMNPPFHPTHPFYEVAMHAAAGQTGTGRFTSWVQSVHMGRHLKPGGRVLFYMMMPGNDGEWDAIDRALQLLKWGYSHCRLRFTRILPTFDYEEFLCRIHAGKEEELRWAMTQAAKFVDVDLIWGEITVGTETDQIEEFDHGLKLDTSWDDRIQLHRRLVLEARQRARSER